MYNICVLISFLCSGFCMHVSFMKVACFAVFYFDQFPYPVVRCGLMWITQNVNKGLNWITVVFTEAPWLTHWSACLHISQLQTVYLSLKLFVFIVHKHTVIILKHRFYRLESSINPTFILIQWNRCKGSSSFHVVYEWFSLMTALHISVCVGDNIINIYRKV
jgi:hypothetical protein